MTFTAGSQPLRLAADAGFRLPGDGDSGFDRPRNSAVVAAALIHLAVIAALLLGWPFAPLVKPVPPAIPVALVIVPPPAPPQAVPKPPPKPAVPAYDRVSGPNQKTTAPPGAEAKGPEAAPKPEPKPAPDLALAPASTKRVTPIAPLRHKPVVKEAKRAIAPEPRKHVSINRAPGEKWLDGDHYLNRVQAMIEQHRFYPANAIGSLGLHLQGVAVYAFMLSPAGTITAIRLEHTSGSQVLDDAARAMIERAAPFPPLPRDFPQSGTVLTVEIPVFPTSS
jgi:periplasmic protein TonB